MDIFKGIGDFFGGLFGQKKKREDEQQQPQQQQSAVSFNNWGIILLIIQATPLNHSNQKSLRRVRWI